ncbi:MAG: hypothetical protein WD071_06655 [Pseudohongiella sp.]|uniref:hypothetical protein n=1 Tax=Pseudohongiella sp. TaxID=1979412 RepID=UPI0034A06005
MITIKAASICLILAFSISMACADTEVTREHAFQGHDIGSLRLDISVGTVRVEPSDSDDIEVSLTISADDDRWFRRTPDVDNMDLRSTQQGDRLRLSFKEKNVNTEWLVKVPNLDQVDIELGVGTVEVFMATFGMYVDVGVGTIDLQASASEIDTVDLSVGVGDTQVYGGEQTENQRAMVSSETSALGKGVHAIKARAGVGDVTAKLL